MLDDDDKTPIEPFMERKLSSQRAMTAIGWVECPACKDSKDARAECEMCWDPESQSFARRVPVDAAIEWVKNQGRAKLPER